MLAFWCGALFFLQATVDAGIVHGKHHGPQQLPMPVVTEELYKEDQPHLNVHVIAHTHDDVGWLKTVDEYYVGSNYSIQDAGVQYILDQVIDALQKDSTRKFIYVEIAFFERWWNEQTEQLKEVVRSLVASGQLEFINGGWCMNDEANTHYSAIIDQMTLGHQFLWKEFGVRPRIGWHIDPFGHAATQASLFAQMGFDGFFFGRIEYPDHDLRNETKDLEFVWRGSTNFGKETEIWSHVLYTDYCYLHGFAWEYGSPPIQDDPRIYDMNIKPRADLFASMVRQRSLANRHNNVLIPFGCDFRFMNAHINYKNMDKLMKYINNHPEYQMTLKYSTPSIYLDAVHDAEVTWSVKTGDFFPYADRAHAYWTGYYTSRPALKGYVRDSNNLAHTTDKLLASTGLGITDNKFVNRKDLFNKIALMDDAYGIAQHHDAVAGTEQQHVADDYAKRLYVGGEACFDVMSNILGVLALNLTNSNNTVPTYSYCTRLNESDCAPLTLLNNGLSITVTIYNPLAWRRTDYYVSLPVPTPNAEVRDQTGKIIVSQSLPNIDHLNYYNLVFPTDLPALGYTTYFVSPASNSPAKTSHSTVQVEFDASNDVVLENEYLQVNFSATTGKLTSIYNKKLSSPLPLTQDYLWWNASAGNNANDQASGAYIFRPNGTVPFPVTKGNPTFQLVTGKLVQEVRQYWNKWVSQVIRLYSGQQHVEFESTIGTIDISDGLGKEVVTRFSSNLKTNGYYYTDSEGMEMITRRRDWRPFPWNNTEPIASNYYPMNAAAYINDGKTQVGIVTDRSRGFSSLADGQFENMLQRRLLVDDQRGVGEPLNETETVRTNEFVYVEDKSQSARHQRKLSLYINNPPTLAFTPTSSVSSWIKTYRTSYTPLRAPLPENVHLLNMRTLPDGRVLVRLHHIYSAGEDSKLSQPVTVDLTNLLTNLYVLEVEEMSLTANQPKSDINRLKWKTTSVSEPEYVFNKMDNPSSITLRPMEIRTFVVRYQNKF